MITGPGNNNTLRGMSGNVDANNKLGSAYVTGSTPAAAAKAPESAQAAARDPVFLSEQARNMLKLEQDIRNQPSVREKRVNELRQQISSGSYNIDTQRIADRMINIDEWF